MDSRKIQSYTLLIFINLLCIILLSACASKQWSKPLSEDNDKKVRALLEQVRKSQGDSSCCLDANITASLKSHLTNGAISGYLQIFLPSSIKIVAINPLGQPLFALASNGKNFQSINAVKGVFKWGRLSTFAQRHDIPSDILDGDWPKWLTGSIDYQESEIEEILDDSSGRGVWLSISKKKGSKVLKEYLLFNLQQKQLIERVILNQEGDELASISYAGWQKFQKYPLPTSMKIVGSSFGAEIDLQLDDILVDQDFSKDNFYLKLPPGYVQQRYP